MHIRKITLKNFKSFGKKVEIPLFRGFTVISGPNGSGKSNIIDSILFCLGLSHTRLLRAEKLTDLIHNGKNCDEAEVSIVFKNEKEEVKITRRVRRTEKGYYSYYYLNGKSVNLSEIHKFLSKYGVYSDAYNIVMQGDVTRITEMTPLQRRKIIDDIAGISEFDEKKEKALAELEVVRENIEKLEAVLTEVNLRLNQLEKDRNEALRYKKLVDEKELNKRYLLAHKFKNIESKINRLKNEIQKLELNKDRLSKRIVEINEQIQTYNSKAMEISSLISQMGDEKYKQIQDRILEITSEIESIKKSKDVYSNEISRIGDEITKNLVYVSKLKGELEELDRELEESEVQKFSVQERVDELEAKVELIKIKLQETDAKFRELRDELMAKRDELDKLKEKKAEVVRQRDRIVETLRRIDIEIEEIKASKVKVVDGVKEIEAKVKEIEEKLNKVDLEMGELLKERNGVDNNIFSIRNKLSSIEEEIKSREVELAKIKASLSTIQTFSKPVELVLEAKNRKALPGIYGTVSQLGEVEEKYALALEVAAGNALQFIVVDGVDDAVRAINYLKQIRGGRATFIPLRKIKDVDVELDKSILSKEGVIDYAINLIKFDKKFKNVFKFIFRDTIVVDNIENAKKLMDNRRIVTLEGDLIEKTGLMSGGSTTKRGMLISKELMEKEKKISDEIVSLNEEKEILYRESRYNEDVRRKLQIEIDRLNEEYNRLRNELSILISKKEDLEASITTFDESVKWKLDESKQLYQGISKLDSEIKELDAKINAVNSRIEEIEKKLKGSEVPKLTSELEKVREELSRNKEVLFSIEKRIEGVEFKKNQIKNLIYEKESYISKLEKEKDELESKIREGIGRVEELTNELEMLKEEEERLGKSIKELRRERDEVLERIKGLEKEKSGIEFEIKSIDEKIRARTESLEILRQEKEELGEAEIEAFDKLPSIEEVTRRLEEIEREILSFGDVNLKAIQEFEEVKKRRDDLFEKKLTLERERSEIIERIQKYEKMKRDAFYEAFNAINKNFAEIIAELTNGEGELYLDSDDPFNSGLHIKVKPYNKPIQRLESMSGGEKSLVALALIFAIQKYKPASFYAFDEIDMFLDGVNVSRVAKLIKNRCEDAQFIVVSLRKPMLEMADSIVGVTLGRDNSSIVTGIKLKA
ncbi:chromosome segregation protein SMC [Archaeoglobales archaeon]|nr:MAG: chromosome segregation protein SMC [Archaeoglobales archaeon]